MFHWVLNTPLLDARIYGCEEMVFSTCIPANTDLNPKCRTTSSSFVVSFLVVAGGIIQGNLVIRAALRRRCCSWTIVVGIYVAVMQMKTQRNCRFFTVCSSVDALWTRADKCVSKLVRNPFVISLYLLNPVLNCSPAVISAVRINICKITMVNLRFCATGSSIKTIISLSARPIKISLNAKVRQAYLVILSSENLDKVISVK